MKKGYSFYVVEKPAQQNKKSANWALINVFKWKKSKINFMGTVESSQSQSFKDNWKKGLLSTNIHEQRFIVPLQLISWSCHLLAKRMMGSVASFGKIQRKALNEKIKRSTKLDVWIKTKTECPSCLIKVW